MQTNLPFSMTMLRVNNGYINLCSQGVSRACNVLDGKILSVTKYRIQIYWYKHVNCRRAPLMLSLTAKWFFEMAGIPSAAFVFDDDLATELETYAKANVEPLSRVMNVALASSDTFSESGLLHW